MKFEEFFIKHRHYLIMSDGGKPVYSRYGDPIENNSIFATLSAMITKFTIFNSNDNDKEMLNVITNNKNKIVFLKKGQLIFIALSKKNDCTSLLFSQLEYLYNQLMSILTISFYSKLEDNPSKCLSTMSGTENLFEQMIQYTSKSFPSLFNSYQVFNYFDFREKLNKISEEFRGDALYCILMTPYEIISLSRSNQINVVSSDLVLIQNLIYSQEMLRTQESYVPICLPGISEQGYIQFYSHFSDENIGVIFVTENMDPMYFVKFQEQYKKIYQKLRNENYIQKIMETFMFNNNILGEYTLIKDEEEKKEEDEITTELLIDSLIDKVGKLSSSNSGNLINMRESIRESYRESIRGNELIYDNPGKNEKLKKKFFEGVKYGVVLNKKYKQLFNAIPFSIAKMKEDDSFVSLRMQSIKDFYEELKNCSESIDKKRLIISLDKMVSSLEDYDVPEEDCIFLSDMIKDFLGSPLENLSIGNKRRKSIYFTYEKENHKIKRFCPRKKSYEC